MKKMLFIMNPVSGQKRAARFLPDIIGLFNAAGYEVITYITAAQGDATRIAMDRSGSVDLVVCCGGDGTLNETITGIIRAQADVPLGYIPAGSTNDLANSLKLSGNIMQAAQDILDGESVPYDIGRFGSRYFSYVASFGAFTKSSYATPQSVKNALGHMAYVLGGITELSQLRKEHVRIEIDNMVIEDDFIFGAICNSTSVGGVLQLDPRVVDMSDGKFELMLVRAPRNLTEITECIQAVQNLDYNSCSMVTFGSVSQLTIYASAEMPWTLDGEREDGHEKIWVENIHHAVRLIKRREAV